MTRTTDVRLGRPVTPVSLRRGFVPGRTMLHRKCACGGSCDSCRKENEGELHRWAGHRAEPDHVPEIVHETLAASGRPLSTSARDYFESRFGQDFSGVRVHADARSAESAAAVNALAYTVGRDIVFASGQYSPDTAAGRQLLAHELAHVAQHAAQPNSRPTAISQRDDPSERSAETLAAAALSGPSRGAAHTAPASSSVVHRQEALDQSKDAEKEARLRRLAQRPSDAISRWRSLSQSDRDTVVSKMGERYGDPFAQEFTLYAKGVKKPNLSIDITNSPPDAKAMHGKGYRYLGDPGGIPIWVHPSGHEIHVLAPSKPAGPSPSETCEKQFAKCVADSVDEDGCRECCAQIPAEDDACRRQCEAACDDKL